MPLQSVMKVRDFFTDDQRLAIQESIASAEKMTGGEIRVHLSDSCPGDAVEAAIKVFRSLKMHATKDRNAVLIFLAPANKKVAIIGDKGINEKVPPGFWDKAYETMRSEFALGRHTEGLIAAISMAGEQLKHYFPYHSTDRDELNNEISYGE